MTASIFKADELHEDVYTGADVCVIGSGASGAVAARELARDGLDVVLLEEGRYYPSEVMRGFKPSDSFRYLYRNYGSTSAIGKGDSPIIPITIGKAVGGSSILTGGVCFRTPDSVVDGWVRRFGLQDLNSKRLEPLFEELERELPVEEVPKSLRSKSSLLFQKGAKALGYSIKPLHRNVTGCDGCSRCIFYCPRDAKKSVNLQYIPEALERGGRVYAGFRVERLATSRERVETVEGTFIGADGKRHRFGVRPRLTLLAAGATHTPMILQKNGICNSSGQVGKNLSIHPAFRVYALFDEEVFGWKGALQSIECDQFVDRGLHLNAIFVPPGMISSGLPEFGRENREITANMKHIAIFGGMITDSSTGVIRPGPGWEPVISYRLLPEEKDNMVFGCVKQAEIFLAAGAKKVYLATKAIPPVTSMDDIARIDRSKVPGRSFECVSSHPLGTARLGTDPKQSVTNEFGRTWDVKNLFITDGSIVPTAIRVNTQMTVMAMGKWTSRHILENRRRYFGK